MMPSCFAPRPRRLRLFVLLQVLLQLLAVSLAGGACGGNRQPAHIATPSEPPPIEPTPIVDVAKDTPPPTSDYPGTVRSDVSDVVHGVKVADPYRWLENADDPAVSDWMKVQDDFARGKLAGLPGRDKLVTRLSELNYVEVVDV